MKHSALSSQVTWFAGLGLALSAGVLIGLCAVLLQREERVPLSLMTDSDIADVPVVDIQGIRNGALEGVIQGEVRLVAGNDIVLPNASGAFRIADRGLLTNRVTISIPAGAQFVASKRGKNFYPLSSGSATRIAPENRIYFKSAESAKAAGFSAGK